MNKTGKTNFTERLSRWIAIGTFIIAIVSFFVTPVLALSWRNLPFPGFMVERTLFVGNRSSDLWTGQKDGITPPHQVVRIAGIGVTTVDQFRAVLEDHKVGESLPVFTVLPDGSGRLFPAVQLMRFPGRDFVSMFWLPYVVGLAYLFIGIWIYWVRGSSRSARALSFFCVCASINLGLAFEVLTTHYFTAVWIACMALSGGALTSLALRFPEQWSPVDKRPWLLGVPYIVSAALAAYAVFYLRLLNVSHYVFGRSLIYTYAVFGAVFFSILMVIRANTGHSPMVRRQARLVLIGSSLAFLPILIWFFGVVFISIKFVFNGALMLPGLLLFPISIALAIIRFRLLEIDALVNRAIVYGVVTAILAGLSTALVSLARQLFVSLTGDKSDLGLVLTTLILGSSIVPIKNRVQSMVDKNLKELPNSSNRLKSLDQQVGTLVYVLDTPLLVQQLLDDAVVSFGADCGAVIGFAGGKPEITHTHGNWKNYICVSIPLAWQGNRYGLLVLGPPNKQQKPYNKENVEYLSRVATNIARIIWLKESLAANGPFLPLPRPFSTEGKML